MESKYRNGKIYKIVNTVNDDIYIGSTYRTLDERLTSHKYESNSTYSKFHQAMKDLGYDKFNIVLLEDYPCDTKYQLEQIEGFYIEVFKKLNFSLLNTAHVGWGDFSYKPSKLGNVFNLNDAVIKSYSKKYVELLIDTIIESINDYPRDYLFINSKNEPYSEKGLQKMLYDLMKDKNIGVNSLRSSYFSYWIPRCNANQVQRIAYLSRTSAAMIYKNYLKKDNEEPEEEETPKTTLQTSAPKTIIKLTPEEITKYKQDRRDYYKQYYEKRKGELLERAKISDKANYYKRAIRDLRSGRKNIEDFKDATIDKYKIEWDRKRNEYISLLDIDY